MSDLNKDTDVAPKVQTEELAIVDDVVPTSEKPDPSTAEPKDEVKQTVTDEEALEKLMQLGKKKDESSEPSRKQKTIEKIASKLDAAITEEGDIDYDFLSKNVANNKLGNDALKAFAEQNGLDIEELKDNMSTIEESSKIGDLSKKVELLYKEKQEAEQKNLENEFLKFNKDKISSYDMTPAQFSEKHGTKFEELFLKYSKSLSPIEAAEIAFELTAGKDYELSKQEKEVQKKESILRNASMPPATAPVEPKKEGLMSRDEVENLPDADRIAYKKQHSEKLGQRIVVNYRD